MTHCTNKFRIDKMVYMILGTILVELKEPYLLYKSMNPNVYQCVVPRNLSYQI